MCISLNIGTPLFVDKQSNRKSTIENRWKRVSYTLEVREGVKTGNTVSDVLDV